MVGGFFACGAADGGLVVALELLLSSDLGNAVSYLLGCGVQ